MPSIRTGAGWPKGHALCVCRDSSRAPPLRNRWRESASADSAGCYPSPGYGSCRAALREEYASPRRGPSLAMPPLREPGTFAGSTCSAHDSGTIREVLPVPEPSSYLLARVEQTFRFESAQDGERIFLDAMSQPQNISVCSLGLYL